MNTIKSPYNDLYMIEPAIDAGVVAILRSRKINAFSVEAADTVTTPYVAVKSSTNGVTGHRAANKRFDAWNGSLTIEIYTNRTDDVQQNRVNAFLTAEIRDALSVQSGEFTPERFPRHDIPEFIETGYSREVFNTESLDLTTLEFSFIVMIKSSLW